MNEILLKKNDIVDLFIRDLGMNGEGIAKYGDYTVFVPFALADEKISAKITFVKKGLAWAEIIKIHAPSKNRVTPVCPYFFRCGGCDLMHVDFDYEDDIKRDNLIRILKKNANLDFPVDPIVNGNKGIAYRNKIQMPFGTDKGKAVLGFFEEKTHKVVPIEFCELHGVWSQQLILAVTAYANKFNISVYDEQAGQGLLRHLVARKVGNKLAIVMVINGDKLPSVGILISSLMQFFTDFSLYINVNKKNTNVIMGDKTVCVYGAETTEVSVMGLSVKLNPMSFLQVNDEVRDLLYSEVINSVKPDSSTVVIDAYAGIGILGALMAKSGARVYNIEIVKEAVYDSKIFAKENGLQSQIESFLGDAKFELPHVAKRAVTNFYKDLDAHRMHLNPEPFEAIKSGITKYEIRLNDNKRKRLSVGDKIVFINTETNEEMAIKVTELKLFDTFSEMYDNLDSSKTSAKDKLSKQDFIRSMYSYYSPEEEHACKTLAIGVEPLSPRFVLILDPPRKGCETEVLNTIIEVAKSHPLELIYISCNPATLSRDLSILSSAFTPTRITPFNMFPRTSHLETLVCLTRKP